MPTPDEQVQHVRAVLATTAHTFPQRLGFALTDDARAVLATLIEQAAERLVREGKADDEEALTRAKSQLMSLLHRAATPPDELRHGDYQGPTSDVDERIVEQTLSKLCPGLWPFC